MSALKRIINKDIKSITENNLNDLGIYVEFNEENLFEAKALIKGTKDSLYENGFLFFTIDFPKNYQLYQAEHADKHPSNGLAQDFILSFKKGS